MTKLKLVGTRNGVALQQNNGISAKRLATDPAFERTRENAAEFGRAGKAAILFCDAFRRVMSPTATKKAYPRLQSLFTKALKVDAVNTRGERTVTNGEPQKLEGFRCNEILRLERAFFPQVTPVIDRATGTLKIDIPEIIPALDMVKPTGASHFRLTLGGAAIDFDNEKYNSAYARSEYYPLTKTPVAPFSLTVTLAPGTGLPLFLVLAIEFFDRIPSGEMMDLKSKAYNAMQVMAVSGKP